MAVGAAEAVQAAQDGAERAWLAGAALVQAQAAQPQGLFWAVCAAFAVQGLLHGLQASCTGAAPRSSQHELLSASATWVGALLYLAAGCGLSAGSYSAAGGARPFFPVLYLGRVLAAGLLLVSIAALARERRPPTVSLAAAWLTLQGALYLGHFVEGPRRVLFLVAAAAQILLLAGTLCGAMGARLQFSPLETVHRFLSTWFVLCSVGYCLAFLVCEVAGLLTPHTEALAYAAVDYLLIGLSSLAISCAGPDKQAPMLPAQEAELSLYPGPHTHGFYPNPDFYDDNL